MLQIQAGLDKTLTVSADEALVLANRYRAAHPSHFPLDQPLVMMNLMEPTTPVDFGKLLWYVNYANSAGN